MKKYTVIQKSYFKYNKQTLVNICTHIPSLVKKSLKANATNTTQNSDPFVILHFLSHFKVNMSKIPLWS